MNEFRAAIDRLGWRIGPRTTLLAIEQRATGIARAGIRAYAASLRANRYAPGSAPPPGPAERRALRRALAGSGLRGRLRALLDDPARRPGARVSGSPFAPVEIAAGLWRWTAPHPGWRPGAAKNSTADWEREVGSVLYLREDAATFVDTLVPDPEQAFWSWTDPRVAQADRCLALTTIGFHRRSRDRLVDRYGASTSRARERLPDGVQTVALRGAGEVVFWLPARRALVCGDRLLGAPGGGLRLCPESWLGYLGTGLTVERLRDILRPLLDLPVERVLVSHGDPVLRDGHAALAEALA